MKKTIFKTGLALMGSLTLGTALLPVTTVFADSIENNSETITNSELEQIIDTNENVAEDLQILYDYLDSSQYVFKEFDKDGNTIFTIYDTDLELIYEEQGLTLNLDENVRVKRGFGVTKLVWYKGFMNVDAYMSKNFLNGLRVGTPVGMTWNTVANIVRSFEGKKGSFSFAHGRVYRIRGGYIRSWSYQ